MKFFFYLLFSFIIIKPLFSEDDKKYVNYTFTAKELVFECKAWIPGETAAQQEAKREYPCIRYIQAAINTYQLINNKNKKMPDLCISNVLNLQRHKDIFIKYVEQNPSKENQDASEVIFESLISSYCK